MSQKNPQRDCFARPSPPPRALDAHLNALAHSPAIQPRDEEILLALRDLKIVSRNQLHRLFWPHAQSEETARKRLSTLVNHFLLLHKFTPAELNLNLPDHDLPSSILYTLSPAGRKWLKELVGCSPGYQPKCNQIIHDLWTAELRVRLTENVRRLGPDWSFFWRGETDAAYYRSRNDDRPVHIPDGLAIIERRRSGQEINAGFFIEMDNSRETHRQLSSRIGRKIVSYDRFLKSNWRFHSALDNLERFPIVLFITRGQGRMKNLALSIKRHRRRDVVYALTFRKNLLTADNLFTAPIWLALFAQTDRPNSSLANILSLRSAPQD